MDNCLAKGKIHKHITQEYQHIVTFTRHNERMPRTFLWFRGSQGNNFQGISSTLELCVKTLPWNEDKPDQLTEGLLTTGRGHLAHILFDINTDSLIVLILKAYNEAVRPAMYNKPGTL